MVEIKLNQQQAVILAQILDYVKEPYFKKLDDVPNKGASIIHPDVFRRTFEDVQQQLENGITKQR